MKGAALLLDTCAAIWISANQPFRQEAEQRLNAARSIGEPVFVSPMTAWEIGMLVSRGRLNLQMNPERWFSRLLEAPYLELAELSPAVLVAASYLPGEPPNDPADRIIAATVREYGYTLVTRDRALLRYADQGYCKALCC
jgi:PIN domain nuclease of toxin-antitoxin system